MNNEEIQSLIKQLKAQGLSEEQIMDTFYDTFSKGEMDRKDLETLAEAMGYELTDDFKNDETPDPIASGSEETAEGGISKEEAEAAKAIEPGQSAEEFKEEIDEMKSGDGVEAKPEEKEEKSTAEEGEENSEKSEDKGEDEKEDWDKAQKLFNI